MNSNVLSVWEFVTGKKYVCFGVLFSLPTINWQPEAAA